MTTVALVDFEKATSSSTQYICASIVRLEKSKFNTGFLKDHLANGFNHFLHMKQDTKKAFDQWNVMVKR